MFSLRERGTCVSGMKRGCPLWKKYLGEFLKNLRDISKKLRDNLEKVGDFSEKMGRKQQTLVFF